MEAEEKIDGLETTEEPNSSLGATLLRVAWLAILLGLGMEVLLLLVASFGESLGLRPLVADFIKSISWWVVVCMGIAVGTAVARAQMAFMGLFGLLTAPLAFELSRVLHKGALQALMVTGGGETGDTSALVLAVIKGIEFGILGLAIGWIWTRPWGGVKAHVGVGLAVGVIFGGTMLALLFGGEAAPTTDVVSRGINEVLFPVGCALVLFTARALGSRATNNGG
ncbi:MAG: hypothetical protein WA982_04525 [Rubrobacteraceae bacterium]